MFCVGISPAELTEADAPPASDKAPATPNAVTTLLRPLPFEVCFERDMAATSLWLIGLGPKQKQFGAGLHPVKHYLCFKVPAASQYWLQSAASRAPAVAVAHNETRSGLLDRPRRWEGAGRHGDC